MGVPCPGCGRQYDVTLFEFGRTIDCTCGHRVGLAPRSRAWTGDERRFIADAMLGRLAQWLRILGFDCEHEERIADERLVIRALEERRTILTRDRRLRKEWRLPSLYLIEATTPIQQLREVVAAFDLGEHAAPFSRCSRCNVELSAVPVDAVRDELPEDVVARAEPVNRCPRCRRLYWEGSHTDQMRSLIDQVLRESENEQT